MHRITFPIIAALVLAFVAALPTRATPQFNYSGLISRSLSMYVLDNNNTLTDDTRSTALTGVWNETASINGLNAGNPWSIIAEQNSDLTLTSITGTGAVSFSTHNDDKNELNLVSQMNIPFTVNEPALYTFAFTGNVSFMDLTTSSAMPASGTMVVGHFYQVFADASTFEFFPPADLSFSDSWSVDLQIIPSPAAGFVVLGAFGLHRRRR
jgi:hypothetical protein